MQVLRIVIPGEMRGKGRPRFARRGAHVRAYTDEQTANAEAWVRACAVDQTGRHLLTSPVSLVMEISVAPPASWSAKKRKQALAGDLHPSDKPDLDNCIKLICDALNGIVWHDDKQVVRVTARKFYAPDPSTTLRICEV